MPASTPHTVATSTSSPVLTPPTLSTPVCVRRLCVRRLCVRRLCVRRLCVRRRGHSSDGRGWGTAVYRTST
ncbi:hypothetical protein GCM10010521_58650 [Streptomyces rameus]|uniref:Uncharacterized protein n=1 Tax=Streptomyces rameus TaxID=68261 RepID=A0ABN3UZI6_9ACTN